MTIQEYVDLAPYTTLGIGGPARRFARAECELDVFEAHQVAEQNGWELFVLGGGSNLLVSDSGFDGLVLQMCIPGITPLEVRNSDDMALRVGAGVPWDEFVQFAVDDDLQGVECLAGIPGTVGGTPVQNVGAYGQEVADTIMALRALDRKSGSFVDLSRLDCGFAYRTSVLNTTERGRYIVTSVDFALHRNGAPKLAYADLKKHFGEGATPTLAETAEAVRTIRRAKGMVVDAADADSRSAGSFFRNPIVAQGVLEHVAKAASVAEVPHWPAGAGMVKLPAAWLLERAGFVRGYVMGRAGISSKHTLALVNRGGATAADIAALRERIVAEVRAKFGVGLEQEPVTVGA